MSERRLPREVNIGYVIDRGTSGTHNVLEICGKERGVRFVMAQDSKTAKERDKYLLRAHLHSETIAELEQQLSTLREAASRVAFESEADLWSCLPSEEACRRLKEVLEEQKMSQCKHGAVVWGECVKCKTEHIANLEAANERLENLLAEGVHTCSRTCKRPMCVLRRENNVLREALESVAYYGLDDCELAARDMRARAEAALKEQDNGDN